MSPEIRHYFLIGGHTTQHNVSVFNGIRSDMAIETTYIKYGNGRLGIIGQTLKPETLKVLANSIWACNELMKGIVEMKSSGAKNNTQKEEYNGPIEGDQKKLLLRQTCYLCSNCQSRNELRQ